jgi:hypothetical protein
MRAIVREAYAEAFDAGAYRFRKAHPTVRPVRLALREKEVTVDRSWPFFAQIADDGVAYIRAERKLLELALLRAPDIESLARPVKIIER